jgi:hypothetical protein
VKKLIAYVKSKFSRVTRSRSRSKSSTFAPAKYYGVNFTRPKQRSMMNAKATLKSSSVIWSGKTLEHCLIILMMYGESSESATSSSGHSCARTSVSVESLGQLQRTTGPKHQTYTISWFLMPDVLEYRAIAGSPHDRWAKAASGSRIGESSRPDIGWPG